LLDQADTVFGSGQDRAHLPISRQCLALNISRSSAYWTPAGVSAEGIDLMRKLDELYLKRPFKGSCPATR